MGEDELLALSAAIAACADWPIKATISGDREGPEDKLAWSEMAESLTSVDWGIEAATEADDSSNSNWELLLVGPEVMIKENVPCTRNSDKTKGRSNTAKNNYNYCTEKQHEQFDWLLQKRYKITKTLLNLKTAPHTITGGDRWPALSPI